MNRSRQGLRSRPGSVVSTLVALVATGVAVPAPLPAGEAVEAAARPAVQESGTIEVSFLGLAGLVPDEWARQEPGSSMRLLQMEVPGTADDPAAEMVVYYFGPDQGGGVEANVERWKSQFTAPDDGPVEPEISRHQVSGMPVTVVELTGTYNRGVGTGAAGPARPDQTLVAAVVETGRGSLFIQLHGHRRTVAAHREAFYTFLGSLHPLDRP